VATTSVISNHLAPPAIKIPEFYHHYQKKGAGQYKAAATNWCQIVTKCREFFLTMWLAEICEADPRV
jgi:hypothetical protein